MYQLNHTKKKQLWLSFSPLSLLMSLYEQFGCCHSLILIVRIHIIVEVHVHAATRVRVYDITKVLVHITAGGICVAHGFVC